MKDRIIQLSEGIIESESPRISFGMESLQGTLLAGKKIAVDLSISSENLVPMKAFLYCTHPRVTVMQTYAVGTNARITLEVNTEGCVEGQSITGGVDVVYNGGETSLPFSFEISIAQTHSISSLKTMEDFFHFSISHFQEAVEIFFSKEFRTLTFMNQLNYQGSYATFKNVDDSGLALIEFMHSLGYQSPSWNHYMERFSVPQKIIEEEKEIEYKVNVQGDISVIMSLWMSYERYRKGGLKTPEQDYEQAFSDCEKVYSTSTLVLLVCAYYYMRENRFEKAKKFIEQVTEKVQKNRMEKRGEYCLFLYVGSKISEDESRLSMTQKLVHKYFTEKYDLIITILEYRLNPDCNGSVERQSKFLRDCYRRGMNSPALYQETCFLWQRNMEDVNALGTYELHVLLFGLRNHLVSEEMLFHVLRAESISAKNLNLFLIVLQVGYGNFQNIELLEAICSLYLQNGKRGESYFQWYKEAVSRHLVMHGLYEYYLSSVPITSKSALPKDLVLYFGHGGEPAEGRLLYLYYNVITKYKDDKEIQELYSEKIKQFALRKMVQEVYQEQMIPLYEKIMTPECIKEQYAAGFLALFHLYHITTKIPGAVRIILHYPQLKQEASYDIVDGSAYAHVFSTQVIMAVETEDGERHFDLKMKSQRLFDNDVMEAQCISLQSGLLILKLQESDKIVERGIQTEEEAQAIKELTENRSISATYRGILYEALIDYSLEHPESHVEIMNPLMEQNQGEFNKEYQVKLVQLFIRKEMYEIAYERILKYGYEQIDNEDLLKLVRHMLKYPMARVGREMDKICYYLFLQGRYSPDILENLEENFNGTTQQMYAILEVLKKDAMLVTELVERTLAQCFFTVNEEYLDIVYGWYRQEDDVQESLERAYQVLRAHQYFLGTYHLKEWQVQQIGQNVFRMPRVVLLALLTYFSENEIHEEDVPFVEQMLTEAVNQNIVLACFEKLGTSVNLPGELDGCAFIEYRDSEASSVTLSGSIQPGGHHYHRVMFPIYEGVFGRAVLLYESECFQYSYQVQKKNNDRIIVEGGTVVVQYHSGKEKTLYNDLNRLESVVEKGDKAEIARNVKAMLLKDEMRKIIFGQKRS